MLLTLFRCDDTKVTDELAEALDRGVKVDVLLTQKAKGWERRLKGLRVFLESHVYAVWDFMSLLKTLQRMFPCVQVPWIPSPYPECRRLINEIVLGEESDEFGNRHLSHFEVYRLAMSEAGANSGPIEELISQLQNGHDIKDAIAIAGVPDDAARFVCSTFRLITQREPHALVAAFTFGREDLIPDMFRSIVSELNTALPGKLNVLSYYLNRHIDVDGDSHGPMAIRMTAELCGDDEKRWSEATDGVIEALEARLMLWESIHNNLPSVRLGIAPEVAL